MRSLFRRNQEIDGTTKADRIHTAIKKAQEWTTLEEIAQQCGRQPHNLYRWMANGQVHDEELFLLSEFTGFRFLYLRDGQLPEMILSKVDNMRDYSRKARVSRNSGESPEDSPIMLELFDSLRIAYQEKKLTDRTVHFLKSFIDEL